MVTDSLWGSPEQGTVAASSTPGDQVSQIPPPPPPTQDASGDAPIPGPGESTFGWRVGFFVVWVLAIGAISAVWQVSARIGHTTWWLGPAGEPNPGLVQFAPFLGPILVLVLIIINHRRLHLVAGLVSAGLIALGVIDLDYYYRLGVIEIVTGTLCLVATLASLVGRVPTKAGS